MTLVKEVSVSVCGGGVGGLPSSIFFIKNIQK